MIQFLEHTSIDKKKWDACIDRSLNGLVYGCSWYLDLVCPGWNALVQDDYTSVMPLTAGKKYGTQYLYPPYFAQQLGVFSTKKITEEVVHEFFDAIPARYKFIEICLNTSNTFEFPGYRVKKNINLELSLDASYEILSSHFSRLTKRNVKKAIKHKVRLQKNVPVSDLIAIFRKNKGINISNLKDRHYRTLQQLMEACLQKGWGESWGAFTPEGKLCAGIFYVIKDNRSIFLFSATDRRAKENGAMFFLIDDFIRHHAGTKMILDFEGSNLPGVARLYKGFGSEESVYLLVRKNNLPKLVRWVKG